MNWLIWRQYRKQLLIFVGIFIIFAAVAIPFGVNFWKHYQEVQTSCSQVGAAGCSQKEIRNVIFRTAAEGQVVNLVKLTLLGLPFLLGLFWGVPLLAKEYAENTNKLVWTQGISRRKWLTTKLAWVLFATVLYAGAFTAVATWFSRTGNAVNSDRFTELAFMSQGVVPVAMAVFAVCVGILFGAWFKRLLPALGATLGLLLVLQIAVPTFARPHYQATQVTTESLKVEKGEFAPGGPNKEDWTISAKQLDSSGKELDSKFPPQQCIIDEEQMQKERAESQEAPKPGTPEKPRTAAFSLAGGPVISINCLSDLGYHWEVKYQPAYRYWNFQRIETALYLVLTGMAVSATYWLVLRRDA
ncbi:MAG TPA: ABC transporter permease [Verrucomicrobiae bacterium]|nr:ABC transporter permease [Verrucomicrobiae bacterium]